MSYANADRLLPPDLLQEVQKYIQGSLIYIPKPPENHVAWGVKSGSRADLDQRNERIRQEKAQGRRIDELADQYSLSPEGIRKILYGHRSPGKPKLGNILSAG